jgi:riboflavin synthase
MFTGIVSDVGEVAAIEQRGDTRFSIACGYDPRSIDIGASIACSGVCLTVLEAGPGRGRPCVFSVSASAETLARSTLGRWRVGTRVNLERALRVGDELGGHLMTGHVDGVGAIVSIIPEGDSRRFRFRAPPELRRFIAPKGSVAIDGTSLTVNEVEGEEFGVNLIAHTLAVTTWGAARVADPVNIEIDTIARYVARLMEPAQR